MPLQKCLRAFPRKRLHEDRSRIRKCHHQQRHLRLLALQSNCRFSIESRPIHDHWRRDRQPRNAVEDRGEQVSRHRHLGQLKRHILRVPRDLGPDFNQLLPQRGQRPVPYRFRQGQSPQNVAEVVGQGEQLQASLVVPECAARELRPLHRVLALFDPLLGRAATVVELDHALGPQGEIGDDESHTREQLAPMPLDLGHHAPQLLPRFRLVLEAVIKYLRPQATAFRDAERLRLREAGRTRQKACDESWLLMLKKFPPVAKGSVRAAGRVEPARLGLPWQDRGGAGWFSWLGGDEGPRQLVKLGDAEANAMVVLRLLKFGLAAGQATLKLSAGIQRTLGELLAVSPERVEKRLRELGWSVERPTE